MMPSHVRGTPSFRGWPRLPRAGNLGHVPPAASRLATESPMTCAPALLVVAASVAAVVAAPPPTARKAVADTYHGVTVTDDYRWLEDWNDKDVQAWSDAQNAYARSVLDKLPGVDRPPRAAHEDHGGQDQSLRGAGRPRRASSSPCAASRPSSSRSSSSCRRRTSPSEAACWSTRTSSTRRARRRSTGSSRRPTASWSRCRSRRAAARSGDVHVFDVATGKQIGRGRSRASTAARPAATWPGRRTARASSTPATRAAASGRRRT